MRTHHHRSADRQPQALLRLSAALMAATFGAELVGGIWTNSVALLSDAGHVFMDLTALLFSLFALRLAQRPASDRRTFGLHRLEVFAAFLNGVLVMGLAAGILAESIGRIPSPPAVKVAPMLVVAFWGLAANLFVAWKLHDFVGKDINLRGAFLHVIGDTLASLGVVIGGAIIQTTGFVLIDPLIAVLVAGILLINALRLLKDSIQILLEGVPRDIELNDVIRAIRDVPGVADVEDTHVWSICSHICSLSAHVTLPSDRMSEQRSIIDAINVALRDRFEIAHSTIQIHASDWRPLPEGEARPRLP